MFGAAPHVLINNDDRTSFISGASDTVITLMGKTKKLRLGSGPNSIQVLGLDGKPSNIFILSL